MDGIHELKKQTLEKHGEIHGSQKQDMGLQTGSIHTGDMHETTGTSGQHTISAIKKTAQAEFPTEKLPLSVKKIESAVTGEEEKSALAKTVKSGAKYTGDKEEYAQKDIRDIRIRKYILGVIHKNSRVEPVHMATESISFSVSGEMDELFEKRKRIELESLKNAGKKLSPEEEKELSKQKEKEKQKSEEEAKKAKKLEQERDARKKEIEQKQAEYEAKVNEMKARRQKILEEQKKLEEKEKEEKEAQRLKELEAQKQKEREEAEKKEREKKAAEKSRLEEEEEKRKKELKEEEERKKREEKAKQLEAKLAEERREEEEKKRRTREEQQRKLQQELEKQKEHETETAADKPRLRTDEKTGKKYVVDENTEAIARSFLDEHGAVMESLETEIMDFVRKNNIPCKLLTVNTIDTTLLKSGLVRGQIAQKVQSYRRLLLKKKETGDLISEINRSKGPVDSFHISEEKTETSFALLDKYWGQEGRPGDLDGFMEHLNRHSENVYRTNPLMGYETEELYFGEGVSAQEEEAFRYLKYYFMEMSDSSHVEIQEIQYDKRAFHTEKEIRVSDYEFQGNQNCWCCSGIAMLRQYILNKYGPGSRQYKAVKKYDQYSLRAFTPDYLRPEEVSDDPDQFLILNLLREDHELYAGKGRGAVGNVFDSSDFFIPFAPEAHFHRRTFTVPGTDTFEDTKVRERNDRIYKNQIYYFLSAVKTAVDSGNVVSALIQYPMKHYLTIVGITAEGRIRYKDSLNNIRGCVNPRAPFGERIFEGNVEDVFMRRQSGGASSQIELVWMQDSTKMSEEEKADELKGVKHDKVRGYHTDDNIYIEMGRRYGCAVNKNDSFDEKQTGGNVGEAVYIPQSADVRQRLRAAYLKQKQKRK